MNRPDPIVLDHHARAADSAVDLAQRLRGQLKIAEETARKLARIAGSDDAALAAENLAITLDAMRIDDVEKGILWLAEQDANQAHVEEEGAYLQDYARRIA